MKIETYDITDVSNIRETFERHPENVYFFREEECPHCQALVIEHDNEYLRCKKCAAIQSFMDRSLKWSNFTYVEYASLEGKKGEAEGEYHVIKVEHRVNPFILILWVPEFGNSDMKLIIEHKDDIFTVVNRVLLWKAMSYLFMYNFVEKDLWGMPKLGSFGTLKGTLKDIFENFGIYIKERE